MVGHHYQQCAGKTQPTALSKIKQPLQRNTASLLLASIPSPLRAHLIACSQATCDAFDKEGAAFVVAAMNDSEVLARTTGIDKLGEGDWDAGDSDDWDISGDDF